MRPATERHLSCHYLPRCVTSNPHADDGAYRSGNREPGDGGSDAAEVELYEDDGNVVLFDAANPLAWVEASRTVRLADAA